MTIRLPTGRFLMDLPFDVFTSASVKYGVPSLARPVGVGTFIGSEVHSRRSSAIFRLLYCSTCARLCHHHFAFDCLRHPLAGALLFVL